MERKRISSFERIVDSALGTVMIFAGTIVFPMLYEFLPKPESLSERIIEKSIFLMIGLYSSVKGVFMIYEADYAQSPYQKAGEIEPRCFEILFHNKIKNP